MTEIRKHVLVWVSTEFLESAGMIQILEEAGLLAIKRKEDIKELIESIERAGGLALTGRLIESQSGSGVWISPEESPGLEVMIPWMFVRSVITAETPRSTRIFGLLTDLAADHSLPRKKT